MEIKTEFISDVEAEDDDDEEEELEDPEPSQEQQQQQQEISPPRTNVSYIIAHGPNGILTIPTYSR